jgi:hypothetical protein
MAVMAQGVTTYAVGTATVAANGTVVTFAGGAALQTTDPVTGVTQYAARAFDQLKVGANRPVLIASVDSATQVTLAEAWPFGAQTAQAYTIIRYSGVANGELAALMQQLLAMSTDASPSAAVTVESGVGRIKLRIGATGKPEVAIGPNGTADASLKAALQMDPATGVVNFPFGTGLGAKPSLRNKLRNPSFQVNQRAVSGTVTLAAGAFGHDGVKAGDAGATYTFANVGQDVRITVTAGSIILPVEANLIDAGSYVLSHEGAAQARVWQGSGTTGSGSYAAATRASPLIVTGLAADTQTNVEFSTGTILRPQFEPGGGVTDYDRRSLHDELAFCRHFFCSFTPKGLSGVAYNPTIIIIMVPLHVPMRAPPTLSLSTLDSPPYAWLCGGVWLAAVTGTLALTSASSTIDGIYAGLDGFSGLTADLPVVGGGSAVWLYASAEI